MHFKNHTPIRALFILLIGLGCTRVSSDPGTAEARCGEAELLPICKSWPREMKANLAPAKPATCRQTFL
jgi:hypothetical protein